MDVSSRVTALEIAHARTETLQNSMAEDVSAIRKQLERFSETLERLNTASARFSGAIVICAVVAGPLVTIAVQRMLGR